MTPSLEHAARLMPWRHRLRWPMRFSFRWVLAGSAAAHVVLFAVLAALDGQPPREMLAVYTVRVVDAPEAAGTPSAKRTRAPSGRAPAQAEASAPRVAAAARPSPVADPPLPASPLSTPEPPRAAAAGDAAPSTETSAPPPQPVAAVRAALPPGAIDAGAGGTVPSVDAKSLDPGFALAAPVAMAYPEAARRARMAGRVRLELEIGPDGRVLSVRVIEATPGWGFADAARDAYTGALFSPPRWQGRPVRVLWRKTLLFQP